MVRLKGLSTDTFNLLYRHFLSHRINMDKSEIKCSAGCGYCCFLRVTASIPEALIIHDFLHKNKEITLYREQLENSPDFFSSRTSKDINWWVKNRIPCLFFDEQRQLCRIYEVRPFTCRSYHSLDMRLCAKAYSQKALTAIPCYPDLKRSYESYSISFERAMKQLGRQSTQYELSSTVALFIQDPDLIDRWCDGVDILTV